MFSYATFLTLLFISTSSGFHENNALDSLQQVVLRLQLESQLARLQPEGTSDKQLLPEAGLAIVSKTFTIFSSFKKKNTKYLLLDKQNIIV